MQIKVFTIPILGGEPLNDDLNKFLRLKKVLQVEQKLVQTEQGVFWCFCVKYLDSPIPFSGSGKKKVDYQELLDEASFRRFNAYRKIRKQVADAEAIPAYAVFTNEELAELAKIEGELTVGQMKKVKGIGQRKIEKYGRHFLPQIDEDEKS